MQMISYKSKTSSALRITAIYTFVAILWILFSDLVVNFIVDDTSVREKIQTYKGITFVVVTASLLMLLISRSNKALLKSNDIDFVTGLPRLGLFLKMIDRQISNLSPADRYAMYYIDIDHFHELKETLGEEQAESFLVSLAMDFEQHIYPGAIVSHVHADEFSVGIKVEPNTDIENVAKKIQHLVRLQSTVYGMSTTCCLGVALYPDDGMNARQLLSSATSAIETAKTKGNYIQFHDLSLTQRAKQRHQQFLELRDAIHQEQLSVVYQPKYSLSDNSVCGVEVLARWNHPDKGFISPDIFIPLAEDYDLIHQLSKLVLKIAVNELVSTDLVGSCLEHISINISASEFNNPHEMTELMAFIKQTPAITPHIRIEITERAALDEIKRSSELISVFQQDGVSFSIDDFGKGYTSLAMLKDLAINEIKIDRSFVSELTSDSRSRTIVSAIIGMAQSFDIDVVAEGVETGEQLAILKELGCQQAQGYYFARPMPLVELKDHLRLEPK